MICPLVAIKLRRYYGDGRGDVPTHNAEELCTTECAWFDKDKGICAILTIAKALNKTGINVRVAK